MSAADLSFDGVNPAHTWYACKLMLLSSNSCTAVNLICAMVVSTWSSSPTRRLFGCIWWSNVNIFDVQILLKTRLVGTELQVVTTTSNKVFGCGSS